MGVSRQYKAAAVIIALAVLASQASALGSSPIPRSDTNRPRPMPTQVRDRVALPVAADAATGAEAAHIIPDVITGLTVEGADICTPASTRTVEQITPIHAYCTTQAGRSPALRATPGAAVMDSHSGVIFQCSSGAAVSAVIGAIRPDTGPQFPDTPTITCPRNHTLSYAQNKLTCHPAPTRRTVTSALAGGPQPVQATGRLDIITRTPVTTPEKCKPSAATTMVMDGGVGE